MNAPERIWTASTDGKCHVGFDTPSMNYTNEYIRKDASDAALAASPEVAKLITDAEARVWAAAADQMDDEEHGAEERDWRSGANAFASIAKLFRARAAAMQRSRGDRDMTDLTDDQVRALLDGNELRSDSQSHTVWLLARALLQARADAAAAVALAYEAAAEFVGNEAPSFPDNVAWCVEDLAKAVRRLAPAEGTAELAKLRDELHLMKTAGIIEVMVRNPSVADYVQHWEGRTLKAEAERDRLTAWAAR